MTFQKIYRKIKSELEAAGTGSPSAEAALITEYACGFDRSKMILYGSEECPAQSEKIAEDMCRQRATGRPLQYILGEWTFCGGVFKVGEGVLIPRDDTEVVVNVCREFLKSHPNAKILDLCSGSGIIAVTLKREFPESEVTAFEKSDVAFRYLQLNIALNNVSVNAVKGDVFTDCDKFNNGSFGLIVSNPPYIRTSELGGLQPEVRREPVEALDGGSDGLDFYRCITGKWAPKLERGGMLAFEIGENQSRDVKRLMSAAGIGEIRCFPDLGGTDRAITGILNQ